MLTRELLTADQMTVAAYVNGQAYVGFGIGGSWVGTVNFEASTIDNPNVFFALSVTPFPSGAAVSSSTGTGNWFAQVKSNIAIVRARFTRTSGSMQVIIGASLDQSYQDAFLSQATIFNSSQVSSGNNTLTQAAQANRAWNLTFCEVSIMAGSYPGSRVDIYDGGLTGTKIFSEFLTAATGSVGTVQKLNLPIDPSSSVGNQTLVGTPGNAMTIQVTGITGANIINTKFSCG